MGYEEIKKVVLTNEEVYYLPLEDDENESFGAENIASVEVYCLVPQSEAYR
jgi:hypothetical protein